MANDKLKFKVTVYDLKAIEAHTQAVAKDAVKVQVKLHSLAVSVLKHWHDSKIDSDEAARLMNGVQEASPYHRKAFSRWVGEMTNLVWNEDDKKWVGTKEGKIMGKQFMKARDVPFWEVSKPEGAKPYDMASAIQAILKQAKRHTDKPVDGDNINVAAIKHLTEALKVFEESK